MAAWKTFTSVAGILGWPYFRARALGRGESAGMWRERMGMLPPSVPRNGVWVHGASVGEMSALAPFIREALRRRREGLFVSTMTITGKRRAASQLGVPAINLPLDFAPWVRRALDAAHPRTVIIAETELWPVFVAESAHRAKLAWINGRISDRSFPRYRAIRPLVAELLERFDLLCVISPLDAERVVSLGAPPGRVRVTGNLKSDLLAAARRPQGVPRGPWFVAGSTRPGEEETVLRAYAEMRGKAPGLRLCLAPRHLSRVGEVVAMARRMGFRVALRSAGLAAVRAGEVMVLDTLGELASFYGLGVAAFVGGTLVPVGGHNVLEPAVAGIPVLFGPHTGNVREEAAGLEECGGGFRVSGWAGLAFSGGRLAASPGLARKAGALARAFVRTRQGVARRVVDILARERLL